MSNPSGGPAPVTVADSSPFPRQSSCQIGTITLKGQRVPVKVHYLLPIYWVFSLISGLMRGGLYFGFLLVTDVVILFLTVFVHELGHSLAAIKYNGTCHAITLWPLGGFAEVSHDKGPKEDLWVSFAGPLTHVPMGLIWYGIVAAVVQKPFNIMYGVPCYLSEASCFWTNVCAAAGFSNLCLLLFNLFIPAYPLDACRILVDFFALCKVEVNRAAMITVIISVPIGFGLMGYGFWALAKGAPNSFMFIFLAFFMLYSTWGVYKAARDRMAAAHPMFTHYYRTSENQTTNSSVSSSAPSSNFTSFSAFASRSSTAATGPTGAVSGPAAGGGSSSAISSMEQGKGYRLGGGSSSTTGPGRTLGGGGGGNAGAGAGAAASAGRGGGRSGSSSALLGGSTGAGASSSSSSSASGAAGGKGYRLGSK